MKLRKIVSTAAATVAATALAASASATLYVPENPASNLSAGTSMWMVKIFVPSEGIDFGVDCSAIADVKVVLTTTDPDFFEGQTGGGFVMSCGPTSICPADHNWASSNFWGVTDEELELDTANPDEAVVLKKIGSYLYEADVKVGDNNCIYKEVMESDDGYVQIAVQEWGQEIGDMKVVSLTCFDANGNTLLAFDENGNETTGASAGAAVDTAAPVEDVVVEAAPVVDEAPAAGDVAAATDSSKGSPDTGVADVAAVAGLALVAGAAIVVAKKRK